MILGFEMDDLIKMDGYNTAQEIVQQPALWKKIYELIEKDRQRMQTF